MAAKRLLLLFYRIKNVPPPGKLFWVTNLSEKMITNDGKYLVFKKG